MRIAQRQERYDDARQRLEELAKNPATSEAAIEQLLANALRSADDDQMLAWSDKAINLDTLPIETRRAWLGVRIGGGARRNDWPAVLDALDTLGRLDPTSTSVLLGRMLVRHMLGRDDEARTLYDADAPLARTGHGASIALVLGLNPRDRERRQGVAPFFEWLAQNNPAEARAYLARLPESRWLFRRDLQPLVEDVDALPQQTIDDARRTLAVMLAIEIGLPEVGAELAQRLVDDRPDYVPGHALRIRALQDMNEDIDAHLRPDPAWADSSFGRYATGYALARQGDYAQAADALAALHADEPRHQHVRYLLAQVYQKLGETDRAIVLLQELASTRGRYQFSAMNDLAYLLADRYPSQRDDAIRMAERLAPAAAISPALADTIGWIEHLRGRHGQALEHLSRVALVAGDQPAVQYHLGAVYHALGESRWAAMYLTAAASGPTPDVDVQRAAQLLEQIQAGKAEPN